MAEKEVTVQGEITGRGAGVQDRGEKVDLGIGGRNRERQWMGESLWMWGGVTEIRHPSSVQTTVLRGSQEEKLLLGELGQQI